MEGWSVFERRGRADSTRSGLIAQPVSNGPPSVPLAWRHPRAPRARLTAHTLFRPTTCGLSPGRGGGPVPRAVQYGVAPARCAPLPGLFRGAWGAPWMPAHAGDPEARAPNPATSWCPLAGTPDCRRPARRADRPSRGRPYPRWRLPATFGRCAGPYGPLSTRRIYRPRAALAGPPGDSGTRVTPPGGA